jgi:hypothetical protein
MIMWLGYLWWRTLLKLQWTLTTHVRRGVYWLCERLLASQKGLWYIEPASRLQLKQNTDSAINAYCISACLEDVNSSIPPQLQMQYCIMFILPLLYHENLVCVNIFHNMKVMLALILSKR